MLNTQKFVEDIDAEILRLKTLRSSVIASNPTEKKPRGSGRPMSPEATAAVACATRLRYAIAKGDKKYAAKLSKELPKLKLASRLAIVKRRAEEKEEKVNHAS